MLENDSRNLAKMLLHYSRGWENRLFSGIGWPLTERETSKQHDICNINLILRGSCCDAHALESLWVTAGAYIQNPRSVNSHHEWSPPAESMYTNPVSAFHLDLSAWPLFHVAAWVVQYQRRVQDSLTKLTILWIYITSEAQPFRGGWEKSCAYPTTTIWNVPVAFHHCIWHNHNIALAYK